MEPFKEYINQQVIDTLGDIYSKVWPEFDRTRFIALAGDGLASLELKERVMQLAHALHETLPKDFDAASKILLASLHPSEDTDRDGVEFGPDGACGFATWPLTEFVVLRAETTKPAKALETLREVTKRFSAEFAVRPFLANHTEEALDIFMAWTKDPNRHVRRLASEGCRPRLPWGMRLNEFVDEPGLIMPILEALKDDPEEYVRRSVANNLNDIAKDHPDMVADIAAKWLKGADRNRQRLVKHACRTLIKQGHAGVLGAFGYQAVTPTQVKLEVLTPKVQYGDALSFSLSLDGLPAGSNLMVDYAIHFVKANGSRAAKVFKWKDMQSIEKAHIKAERQHAIKPITTRKYYAGEHLVEIFVNGASVARAEFELLMP